MTFENGEGPIAASESGAQDVEKNLGKLEGKT